MKYNVAIIGLKGLPSFGGAAAVGENIIKQLHHKYNFTVYSIETHTKNYGYNDGYEQIVFKKSIINKLNVFFYYIKSLVHCLFKVDYDIIHLHHIDAAFIIPFLRLKYKVIATHHGRPQTNKKWGKLARIYFGINEKIFFHFTSIITMVSKPLYDIYHYKKDNNIYYIPNGINILDIPSKSENVNDGYIIFVAARIIPIKGCHTLLKALHNLNYKGKLLIIGDINQNQPYKEMILKLGNKLNIEFLGLVKNKEKLMKYVRGATFFIFPSETEAMSMMLLEAASQCTPIIASNITENKAVFDENEVLYFESENYEDLAKKILWAQNNKDGMLKKSKKALKKIENYYKWKNIAKQYDELYNKLIFE